MDRPSTNKMSELTSTERRRLEKFLVMGGGYVLNFTDRTFGDFFSDHRVEIDDEQYLSRGTSKANRMRTFWDLAPNHVVAKVTAGLIDYALEEKCAGDMSADMTDALHQIVARLRTIKPVSELDSLSAIADERDFEVVAEHVREAIEKNQPEAALDRLHTYVHKFLRVLCEPRGIVVGAEKPLHSVMGEYIKALRSAGHLQSDMTDRILRSSISILETFDGVRNNQSLAHDNPILNYEESLLIFNSVAASVRFIRALENKINRVPA